MGAEDRRAGWGGLPQTFLWPSGKSFHPKEVTLDTERLHKDEGGAWLGEALAQTSFLGGFQSHRKVWPLEWEASSLVSALKGLEGARGRLGDSGGEAGCGDGSAPTPT